MSRSKHQFRPAPLEVFEERITPSVSHVTADVFTPPGQVGPFTTVSGYTTGFATNVPADNFLQVTVTNDSHTAQYLTFAVYTAPGGGNDPTSNAYDNSRSQNLVYSQTTTFAVAPRQSVTFTVDVSKLKLTGQDKLQADVFLADGPSGYAPDKIDAANTSGRVVFGDIFDFEGKKNN